MSDNIRLDDSEFSVTTDFKFVMVPHWLLKPTDEKPLPSAAVHIYCCLMTFANKDKECFPSYNTLSEMTGLSKTTIAKHLLQLIQFGAISRQKRAYKGYNTSNLYHLPQVRLKVTSEIVKDDKAIEAGFNISQANDSGFAVGEDIKKKASGDPFWAVMSECFGYFPQDKPKFQEWGVAIAKIKTYTENAEDIKVAHKRYPEFMPKGATLTVSALAKHFPDLLAKETDKVLDTYNKLEAMKQGNVIDG